MARPKTKGELIAASIQNHAKLEEFFASMNTRELATPFDFSSDAKKIGAHWSSADLSERNATTSSLPVISISPSGYRQEFRSAQHIPHAAELIIKQRAA